MTILSQKFHFEFQHINFSVQSKMFIKHGLRFRFLICNLYIVKSESETSKQKLYPTIHPVDVFTTINVILNQCNVIICETPGRNVFNKAYLKKLISN